MTVTGVRDTAVQVAGSAHTLSCSLLGAPPPLFDSPFAYIEPKSLPERALSYTELSQCTPRRLPGRICVTPADWAYWPHGLPNVTLCPLATMPPPPRGDP